MKKIERALRIFCVLILMVVGIVSTSFATDKILTINTKNGVSNIAMNIEDGKGDGWEYNSATKTLTLNGFEGKHIYSEEDLTIKLVGANRLTDTDTGYGITLPAVGSTLTIEKTQSDETDKLIINRENMESAAGISVGKLIINGGMVVVDIETNDAPCAGVDGILGNVEVRNNANLSVIVATTGDEGARALSGIMDSLDVYDSADVKVDVQGVHSVYGVWGNLRLNDGCTGTIQITATTTSDTEMAFACENLEKVSSTSNLIVYDGIVGLGTPSSFSQFSISNKIEIESRNSNRDWVLLPLDLYSYDIYRNEKYTFVDSKTGEIITDGLTFTPQGEVVDFEFIESNLFDIPESILGEMLVPKYNENLEYISLIGGFRGVDFLNDRIYFEIEDVDLPEGITLKSNGRIKGEFEEYCEAGSVTISATRKSDGSEVEFTINYGKINVPNPVKTVELDKTQVTLEIGEVETLVATVNPTDATIKNVNWKSSNSNIVEVFGNGRIEAKSAGEAIITVITEEGKKTASCIVTVKPNSDGFYALMIDEDDEEELLENKIYSRELYAYDSIALVLFENGRLIESSDENLNIEGVFRDKIAEAEFIADATKDGKRDYKYSDNIIIINGFYDYKEAGTISYNNNSIQFKLKGLNYREVENNVESTNKNYILNLKEDDEGAIKSSFYAKFYYNDSLLNVEEVTFCDNSGNVISDNIIKTEPTGMEYIWLITGTSNISGKAVLKTTSGDTYEMLVNIDCYEVYFGDEDGNEISKFLYSEGVNEVFYLYGYFGEVKEVKSGNKVSYEYENERIKFIVNNCDNMFNYMIEIEDDDYRIKILPPELCGVYANEIIINNDGTVTKVDEALEDIYLFSGEKKYFVFYNEGELTTISDVSKHLIAKQYTNSIFDTEDYKNYVYEVYYDGKATDEEIEIGEETISVSVPQIVFAEYEENELEDIKKFRYKIGEEEKFYLYVEGRNISADKFKVLEGKDYATLKDAQLDIKGKTVNVIEVSIGNFSVREFELEVSLLDYNINDSVTVINTDIVPMSGFFTSLDRSWDTFVIGEDDDEIIFVPGQKIYYIMDLDDTYIPYNSEVSIDDEFLSNVDINLVPTGKYITIDSQNYERYAIEITVLKNAEMNFDCEFDFKYMLTSKETKNKGIELEFVSIFEEIEKGETGFKYNEKRYIIGFCGEDDYIVSDYSNRYSLDEKGKDHNDKFTLKIFSTKEIVSGNETLEVYVEETELYNKIEDVDMYIGVFDTKTMEFKKADSESLNCVVLEEGRETSKEKRWYATITNKNQLGEYYILADVTIGGVKTTVVVEYDSYEIKILDLDLTHTTTLSEVNESISDIIENSDANIINVKLNPLATYGEGKKDEGELVLEGDKEFNINGNGATIIGSVNVISPVKSGNAPYHKLTNIHFVSADKDIEDEENIGIYGSGQLMAEKCTFSYYNKAINMYEQLEKRNYFSGVKNALSNCIFENNKYGIYVDQGKRRTLDKWAAHVNNCRFVNNEVAFYVVNHKNVSSIKELFEFSHCEFIDNEEDIISTSGFEYLAYGCVFGTKVNSGDDTITIREPKNKSIKISYVYREEFLDLNDKGFIEGNYTLPEVAYAPYNKDGKLDDFSYKNNINIGVDVNGFDGKINVIGDYDMSKDNHKQFGSWNFKGKGDKND